MSYQQAVKIRELHYDFRPEKASGREVKGPTDERLVTMRDKLRTEKGKTLYGRHNHTVEPVFGIIKVAMGFREFSLRGKAYNLKRLHRMTESVKNNGGRPKSPSMHSNVDPNDIGTSPVERSLGSSIDTICRRLHRLVADSTTKLSLTPTDS